jgi:hypothetical protein
MQPEQGGVASRMNRGIVGIGCMFSFSLVRVLLNYFRFGVLGAETVYNPINTIKGSGEDQAVNGPSNQVFPGSFHKIFLITFFIYM